MCQRDTSRIRIRDMYISRIQLNISWNGLMISLIQFMISWIEFMISWIQFVICARDFMICTYHEFEFLICVWTAVWVFIRIVDMYISRIQLNISRIEFMTSRNQFLISWNEMNSCYHEIEFLICANNKFVPVCVSDSSCYDFLATPFLSICYC